MSPNLGLICDNLAVVANKAGVEVEDDVDEEKDVDNRVNDEHLDISAATGGPEKEREPGLVWEN